MSALSVSGRRGRAPRARAAGARRARAKAPAQRLAGPIARGDEPRPLRRGRARPAARGPAPRPAPATVSSSTMSEAGRPSGSRARGRSAASAGARPVERRWPPAPRRSRGRPRPTQKTGTTGCPRSASSRRATVTAARALQSTKRGPPNSPACWPVTMAAAPGRGEPAGLLGGRLRPARLLLAGERLGHLADRPLHGGGRGRRGRDRRRARSRPAAGRVGPRPGRPGSRGKAGSAAGGGPRMGRRLALGS